MSHAHRIVEGCAPDTYAAPYGSDLRLLSGLGGIPTVQYGPGDAGVAHAPNEYVTDRELLHTHHVLAQFLSSTLA